MENSLDNTPTQPGRKGRGLSLNSGGLDSQLAICVLKEQGVEIEAVAFSSPFFSPDNSIKASKALGVKVHVIDFTSEIVTLLKCPPHGFGSCMNPCIDCHAVMIRKAAELMKELDFDFVCTGEVLGQRPMSQQRRSLEIVRETSGIGDRLLRPLSALLLTETEPERLGLVDRSKLLGLSGRNRKPQIALAKKYGLVDYPTPSGGCKLTEPNFTSRLQNLKDHEGIDDARLLNLLSNGRHLRLPSGTLIIVGRDKADNATIRNGMRGGDVVMRSINVPGPTVLAIQPKTEELELIRKISAAFSDHKAIENVTISEMHAASKPVEFSVLATNRDTFTEMMI